MTPSRQKTPARLRPAMCAFLVAFAAAAAYGQVSPAPVKSQPQIIKQVEAAAEAYKANIAKMPIEVQQTIRYFDASGHLKRTRRSSYRYAPAAASSQSRRDGPSSPGEQSSGVDLSDGATLPLLFLPGSLARLSIRTQTPANGPWIIHFKSTPCAPPEVRRHRLAANIVSQCVEGEAFLDPKSGALTRIRMNMAGLPIAYRSLTSPLGTALLELYNDTSFRQLQTAPGAKPRLLPAKSRFVTYTSRGRTVVEKTFEIAHANP